MGEGFGEAPAIRSESNQIWHELMPRMDVGGKKSEEDVVAAN